ncbi:hypothetical protein JYT72_00950 [Crocinitomix catalasitica]|nr:hypothetical protein [Crocinitomix catalasitica]
MKRTTLIILLCFQALFIYSQNENYKWELAIPFEGSARAWSTGFFLNNSIYITTGFDSLDLKSDVWEFNFKSKEWLRKTDFQGVERDDAIGLATKNRGYVGFGLGTKGELNVILNDLWEYIPKEDKWVQKTSCPGKGRLDPFSFIVKNKIYIGCGRDSIRTGNFLNDVWEYDIKADKWIQKKDFPGDPRFRTISMTIKNKGYVGLGQGSKGLYKDFWEYNPKTDEWIKKSALPFENGRLGAAGFSINNMAYVGLGTDGKKWFTDFWSYHLKKNEWEMVDSFKGEERAFSIGLSVKKKGVILTGFNLKKYLNDVWIFSE